FQCGQPLTWAGPSPCSPQRSGTEAALDRFAPVNGLRGLSTLLGFTVYLGLSSSYICTAFLLLARSFSSAWTPREHGKVLRKVDRKDFSPPVWSSRTACAVSEDDFLYSVSVLSGILCTALAVIKFMLGKVLTSRALITDGFNSLVGGIMGFSILLSAEVFKHNSSVWYLDGSIGVLIGLTIFAYGIKLLIDMVPRVRQTRHYEMFE
ncbi:PREDICTED: transmembrane protein 163-like, partial [Buceros rhinoceros silvestris]|uniref:transmembrane protein 163-like n=1 Tax=Buceros rhinoceros silvestris TaxID=175836 RepID=UPI0005286C64